MTESIRELRGGNMDIDLIPKPGLAWEQEACPWNDADQAATHKCAVKDTSICRYFRGIKALDTVLCAYPTRED
ncbi:MAG: hypothetical protein HYR72_17455 [Deltaproteobacteria bacterium]|nr:hypothetical protein [Deltaproteobacteria bacterium]MBI3386492.1 hypothetical protein [Deltaproteobacteria bacterium]